MRYKIFYTLGVSLVVLIYFSLFLTRSGFIGYIGISLLLCLIFLSLGIIQIFYSLISSLFQKVEGILWLLLSMSFFFSIGAVVGYETSKNLGLKDAVGGCYFFYPFYFSIFFLLAGGILLIWIGLTSIYEGFSLSSGLFRRKILKKLTGIFIIVFTLIGGILQYPLLTSEIKSIQKMKEMVGENKEESIENIMRFFEKFDKEMKKSRE